MKKLLFVLLALIVGIAVAIWFSRPPKVEIENLPETKTEDIEIQEIYDCENCKG